MRSLGLFRVCALVALLAPGAAAQCFPDGLDLPGAVCAPAATQVRPRSFKQPTLGILWQDCSVIGTAPFRADWSTVVPFVSGNPPQVSCAWFRANVRLYNAANVLAWQGVLQLSYARTWLENPAPGQTIQVMRYLVNGDLRALLNSSFPGGNPACAASFGNRVRFTGYVDYTIQCGTTATSTAWMLAHVCDSIDHVAGYPRAGTFHPGRNFAFVGPSAGFVPAAGTSIESGAYAQESMRQWDAQVLPARCQTEELITPPVVLSPSTMLCMCGTGPANWFEGLLSPVFGFASSVSPFPGSAPFRSFPVGRWTNPAQYPGVEELRWNCNEGQWVDCTGAGRQEFYYGVTTVGGYPAQTFDSLPSVPLGGLFIDQANSALLPAGVAVRNVPFRSDHWFGLNQ